MTLRTLLSLSVAAVLALLGAPAANADVFGPVGSTAPGSVPTGNYIVKFTEGTPAADQAAALEAVGATELSSVGALRLHTVTLPDGALDQLRADPSVERVETEQSRAAMATPSDPGFGSQWSLSRIGWDQVYGSVAPEGSATVAVLDTGVDASHADLAGNVVPGTSILDPGSSGTTDSNGHGTEMAGIVAAQTDNGEGMAGIGYTGVKVMPVTVLDGSGTGQDGDIINGVVWAADHGADVILMAFSSPDFSPSLQEAIDYAWSKGAVLVAATGNDGSSAAHFPAGDRGVVGVASTDESDALTASSNYGEAAFIAAPGAGMYTTANGGGYTTITGTSASAAEVAGSAALMRANAPEASNGTIVSRLARSADPISSAGAGNGRLNLARAIGDLTTMDVQPAGAAPVGEGGPFVGPYTMAAAITARAGGGQWDLATTWNASAKTGTITTSTASPVVTGSGTSFLTELAPGDALYRSNGNTLIGTVLSIATNTQLTLTTVAQNNNSAASYTASRVPGSTDTVSMASSSSPVIIPADFTAHAQTLDIGSGGNGDSFLTLSAGSSALQVEGNLRLVRPSNNATTNLVVNAGTVTVGGVMTFDGASTANSRVDKVTISSGLLQVAGDLVFTPGNNTTNVIDMSPAPNTGTVRLSSGFLVNNAGSVIPGLSTFDFNGTSAQTIPIGQSGVVYGNLHTNNTSAAGATLSAPISPTNVLGNLRVQTGTLDNGGNAIVGNPTRAFEVADGATFRLTGTSALPSNFASRTFGATSTTDYNGSTQTIGADSYGHLSLTGAGAKSAGGAITVRGDWTQNVGAAFAPGANTVTFSGNAATQTIGGTSGTTFNGLTVNKSAGVVALARDTNVAGALTFTNGNVTTGAFTLVATGTVNHTSGHVVGNLRRPIPAGSPTVRFDVGSGANYTPAELAFTGVTSASGSVTASTTASEHPNITASGIRSDKDVNRYWTLTPGGGLAFTSYNATFTFVAGDVDAGADTNNFIVRRYDGTNWNATTTGTRTATSTQATGVTSMSDFAVGEADAAGPVTSNVQVAPTPTNTAPTVTASVSDATTGGANVAAAEYFIDTAGAAGTGTAMNAADGSFNSATENVTKALTASEFNALSDGQHTVYVRGRDANGNWGAVDSASFVKDATGPTTTITFPADAAVYNTAGWNAGCTTPGLCGTASDATGFGNVQVSIKRNSDNTYWNGSSFASASETYNTATGTTSWSYALAASSLTDGVSYTVHAKGTDSLGNAGGVTASTFTYDTASPSLTVEQAAGQNDPTKTQPIHFTATFSEPVTGFTAGDVTVGGTAGHASANVNVTPGPGNSYDIAVSNLSSDGTVTASIDADKAQDAAGNGNTASSSVDNEVTLDQAKPSSHATSPAYSNASATDIPVDYTAGDNAGGTGLKKVELWAKKDAGSYTLAATDNTPGTSGTFSYTPSGDGTYRFYTIAEDNAGNREDVPTQMDTVTVQEDTTTLRDTVAPSPTLSAPPAYTNDDTPAIAGTAGTQAADGSHSADDDHVTVKVFSGTTLLQTHSNVAVNPTTGAFSVDASHLADGVYTARVDQSDAAGNGGFDERAFEVDTLAPNAPTIDTHPDDPTKQTTADFTFTAAEAGGTLECKLDSGDWQECDSPSAQTYTGLAEGSHTFNVRQVDAADNPSNAAAFTWFVDLTAPNTSIDSQPDNPSNDTSPSFTFSGTDNHSDPADLTFECKLNDGAWHACTSPEDLSGLAEGSHTFSVRATDEAGNTDASPASFTWFVDVTAPNTSIDSQPSDPSGDASPSFEFSGSDNHSDAGDLTFGCKLDDADWHSCTSPEALSGLSDGEHTFQVRAIDEAGNTDATPASFTWVIDTVKPQSHASSPATTNDTAATFEVGYTASDERSGLDKVELYASKNGGPYSLANTDSTPGATGTFNFTHSGDGTYRFYTIATDKAGNVEGVPLASDDTTVVEDSKTLRDTAAPDVTLSAPPANTNDDTPTISGTAGTQTADTSHAADDDHVKVEVLDDTNAVVQTHNSVPVNSATGAFSVDASHLADGDYTAKATQADAAGNQDSDTRAFTVDTVAPNAPTIDSGPTDPTNETTAEFSFHGDEPGGTFQCKLDSGSYEDCDSPKTYDSLTEGGHSFHVRQVDDAGNPSDAASFSWYVDLTDPTASIDSHPPDPSNDATPDFSFSGSDDHSTTGDLTLECNLDGGGWSVCTSPKTLATLTDASHTFEVRATDKAGNTDQTPAGYTWMVDTSGPGAPTITTGPGHLTTSSNASFEWTGAESGGQFECKVDGAAFAHCHSPEPYLVAEGHHKFSVRQVDDAGNPGTVAEYEWDVDQTNPNTSIDSHPANPDNDATPDFTFSGTDNFSTPAHLSFQCQVDGGGWNACNSPKTLAALTDASHTFEVRSTDEAGNTDATPDSYTWTVDTAIPDAPAITSPADNSFNKTGSVTVQGTAENGSTVELFDGATSKGTTTATGGNWSKTVTGVPDGSHTYTAKATDSAHNTSGASNSRTVVVDTVKPTSTASAPASSSSNNITVTYTASDNASGSGLDKVELYVKPPAASAYSLAGTDTTPNDTQSFAYTAAGDGTYSFYTVAYDRATNAEDAPATPDATTAVSTVALFNFTGFFKPVDNLPTLNEVKSGSSVPVKFSLGGNKGLSIFAADYPKSQVVLCNSTAPVDGLESTATPGAAALTYDAATGQYTYVWKTEKSWTGCRQLVLKFSEGTYARAEFKFK